MVETPAASRDCPGDEILAIPTDVCPTVALYRQAYVDRKRAGAVGIGTLRHEIAC